MPGYGLSAFINLKWAVLIDKLIRRIMIGANSVIRSTAPQTPVTSFLPPIDLTELLLEIHAHTGFADTFTHVSESNARADNLAISICAVLIAEACNIGIEPLIKHNIPALTRHRLNWVKQNYMRAETLTSANSQLVDYHTSIPLAKSWGGGEVASADGMRFVTPVRTINSGPNKKYFGSDRGITWYNFISDQFSGFHGIVVPGTLRDSIFVLGLINLKNGLSRHTSQTHGIKGL